MAKSFDDIVKPYDKAKRNNDAYRDSTKDPAGKYVADAATAREADKAKKELMKEIPSTDLTEEKRKVGGYYSSSSD